MPWHTFTRKRKKITIYMIDVGAVVGNHLNIMSDWTDSIDALIDYLRYQQENGVREIPLDTAALKKLSQEPHAATTRPEDDPQRPAVACDSADQRQAALARIAEQAAACSRCPLAASRTRVVPGQGNAASPDIMFVGEAPGREEDQQGVAFIGAAGQLLTKMIAAMGYTREDVFIANICKCRPPGNRKPTVAEMRSCLPFLQAQIEIIKPKVIIALGATAATGLLNTQTAIGKLRGQWTRYGDVPLMPTFHPAYLLRFPPAKRDAWNDLQRVLAKLGRSVPQPKEK